MPVTGASLERLGSGEAAWFSRMTCKKGSGREGPLHLSNQKAVSD